MIEMLNNAKGSEKHRKWVLCLEKTVSGNERTFTSPVTEHPSTGLQVYSGQGMIIISLVSTKI